MKCAGEAAAAVLDAVFAVVTGIPYTVKPASDEILAKSLPSLCCCLDSGIWHCHCHQLVISRKHLQELRRGAERMCTDSSPKGRESERI
jgi:hypothetical protein